MKKTAIFILFISISFAVSSCTGILMPYHESFECNRGVGGGYCGPVTSVYKTSLKQSDNGGMQW